MQTAYGLTPIGSLQVGDQVLDQYGNAVFVTGVRGVRTGPLYEVSYSPFDSANWHHATSSFRCTPDHILLLTISGASPTQTAVKGYGDDKRRLDWRSWCHNQVDLALSNRCRCGVFRKVSVTFPNEA